MFSVSTYLANFVMFSTVLLCMLSKQREQKERAERMRVMNQRERRRRGTKDDEGKRATHMKNRTRNSETHDQQTVTRIWTHHGQTRYSCNIFDQRKNKNPMVPPPRPHFKRHNLHPNGTATICCCIPLIKQVLNGDNKNRTNACDTNGL